MHPTVLAPARVRLTPSAAVCRRCNLNHPRTQPCPGSAAVDLFDGDAASAPSLARHLRAATSVREAEIEASWAELAERRARRKLIRDGYTTVTTATDRYWWLVAAQSYDLLGYGEPSLVDELLALDTVKAAA
jgi:hypothetical protein